MPDTSADARLLPPFDVDILILSYNACEHLRETLRGLTQTAAFVSVHTGRIIVLDNASSDGSAEMVRSDFPQVELIASDQNLGFGQGMNRLAIRATAEHIMLLNSDVIVEDDFLTELFVALEQHDTVVATGPKLVWTDGRTQYSACDFPNLGFEAARFLGRIWPRLAGAADRVVARFENRTRTENDPGPWCPDFIWATCWLMRRDDFLLSGMFDPEFPIYDEDLDLCRRWARNGRQVMYVPASRLVHVGNASSDVQTASRLALAGRRTYYRRYYGRLGEWCFTGISKSPRFLGAGKARIRRLLG